MAAKKPPALSLAKLIATPGRRRETVLDLPSRALCVGDPITDMGGRVELGVASVSMFFLDVGRDEGRDEDEVAIVVRARPTVAVRWENAPTGGVDSGVFGVWDADARMTGDARGGDCVGACEIGGRRVFALQTGDGGFPCVVGFDERGEACAVIAGPGVDPERFKAVVREEHMTDEERAEKAAEDARDAALAANDLLGAKLGERKVSAPLRWFVAGWLASLPEAERAAARKRLEPAIGGLAIPKGVKAKDRAKADIEAILGWAQSGWAVALAATSPEVAEMLAFRGGADKEGAYRWAETLSRVFDSRMPDRRYDLERPYALGGGPAEWAPHGRADSDREPVILTVLRDVPKDLSSRFGLTGILAMIEKIKPHHHLNRVLWYVAHGLEKSLELHVLATRATDLSHVEGHVPEFLLRPRDSVHVEELLAKVETPVDFLLRLAGVR